MTTSVFHVGIDDTDSSDGMCTTFLMYNIVKTLRSNDSNRTSFIDYPNLIRHNPNIPWKTRGNASLVMRVRSELSADELFSLCTRFLRRHSTSEGANSGLVLLEGEKVPSSVRDFSRRSLSSVLSVKEALDLIEEYGMRMIGLRSKQGLVGALAGIGNKLESDYTFELIAYRRSVGVARKIDSKKILTMDEKSPLTFSNIDRESGRIMILPHGPDPVLCGIRGESAGVVKNAFRMLMPVKNCQGWMIFRSNQGTGEHLLEEISLAKPKAYSSGWISGRVTSNPRIEKGGHVFFKVENQDGGIECAFYEPTGGFRKKALSLMIEDELLLGGGIRKSTSKHSKVLNVELLKVISTAKCLRYENPMCEECGLRMSSLGKGQGYSCKLGHVSKSTKKIRVDCDRDIKSGVLYLPPVRAHRHLTKPIQRYSLAKKKTFKTGMMIQAWIS